MNSYICLDSSVLIKLLVNEEDSDKAASLMEMVVNNRIRWSCLALPGLK